MHIEKGLHGYGFQHCVHTTYPHFRGCLTALVMREGVEIADDELARFMTRQCHADQHPMFLVYQINGDRPLLTPEDVVPNNFHPHPPLHLLEVIRPLRICTAERTEKKGVKCVKRSARVSTCTTNICFTNVNKRFYASMVYVRGLLFGEGQAAFNSTSVFCDGFG